MIPNNSTHICAARPSVPAQGQAQERFLGEALETLDEIDLIIAKIEGGMDAGVILMKIANEIGNWKKERDKLQAAPDTGAESHEHNQVWSNSRGWVCTSKCKVCALAASRSEAQPPQELPAISDRITLEHHSDDKAVLKFAKAMCAKLSRKRAEGYFGWDNPDDCTVEHLAELLIKHVPKGDTVDIANFCMMLWNRLGGDTALRKLASAPAAVSAEREKFIQEAVDYLKGMSKLYIRDGEHTAGTTLSKVAIGIRTALAGTQRAEGE